MEYRKIIGNRLRQLCKKRQLSIHEFSEMCGVSQSTLNNIANGGSENPKLKTIHKIAIGFCMTISEFLNFQELDDYSFEDEKDKKDENSKN